MFGRFQKHYQLDSVPSNKQERKKNNGTVCMLSDVIVEVYY